MAIIANTKCLKCGMHHVTAVPNGSKEGDRVDGLKCLSVGKCTGTERTIVNFIH